LSDVALEGGGIDSASIEAVPEGDARRVAETQPTTHAAESDPTGRENRTPYDEPEFREALVRSLVQTGLSATDGERVADAAIKGLTKCIATNGLETARASVLEACQSDMWQQTGLNEDVHRRAIMAAYGRELSRRRALEAAVAGSDRAAATE
jgi:hypothetical protein